MLKREGGVPTQQVVIPSLPRGGSRALFTIVHAESRHAWIYILLWSKFCGTRSRIKLGLELLSFLTVSPPGSWVRASIEVGLSGRTTSIYFLLLQWKFLPPHQLRVYVFPWPVIGQLVVLLVAAREREIDAAYIINQLDHGIDGAGDIHSLSVSSEDY